MDERERDAVIGKAEQTKVNPHKLAVGDEEEARGLGSFRHPRPLHRACERRQARLTLEARQAAEALVAHAAAAGVAALPAH